MRAWLLAALVACGGSAEQKPADEDCVLIERDPATAPAALSKKYPGQAVKVAETIERCIAPDGDSCQRLAKIVKAIPSMMPGAETPENTEEICRGMPVEMQRCMLPSYILAHQPECAKVMDTIRNTAIDKIDITPRSK